MIRRVDTEDWEKLRSVRLRALASDPGAFLQTHAEASTLSREHWRERATPSETQASFLLEDAGMVSCFVADDPHVVFLVGMWVAPERRGTGAARALVEHVLDWSRAHDARLVALSVEGDNDRAARLYEKCGFLETYDPPPFPYTPNAGNRFYVYEL
jgi:ribosomal protein S18 acetylase RimI-like enzyme